jgi:hypothetical protein
MHGAIPPLPQHAFMVWCSVKRKHGDNFTIKEAHKPIICIIRMEAEVKVSE